MNRDITYEEVRKLIKSTKMSARPEFYSGRGAMECDLNGKQLEQIYRGIVGKVGLETGKNFIRMVADIEVLSATRFLNSLYNLYHNDWKYKIGEAKNISNISIDGEGAAWGTIGSVLSNNKINETDKIRNGFLYNHKFSINDKKFYYEIEEERKEKKIIFDKPDDFYEQELSCNPDTIKFVLADIFNINVNDKRNVTTEELIEFFIEVKCCEYDEPCINIEKAKEFLNSLKIVTYDDMEKALK